MPRVMTIVLTPSRTTRNPLTAPTRAAAATAATEAAQTFQPWSTTSTGSSVAGEPEHRGDRQVDELADADRAQQRRGEEHQRQLAAEDGLEGPGREERSGGGRRSTGRSSRARRRRRRSGRRRNRPGSGGPRAPSPRWPMQQPRPCRPESWWSSSSPGARREGRVRSRWGPGPLWRTSCALGLRSVKHLVGMTGEGRAGAHAGRPGQCPGRSRGRAGRNSGRRCQVVTRPGVRTRNRS